MGNRNVYARNVYAPGTVVHIYVYFQNSFFKFENHFSNFIFMVGSAKSQFNVPDEKWILPEFENWTNNTDLNDKIQQRNSTEHLSIFYSAISIPFCNLNFEPIRIVCHNHFLN